MKKDFKDYTDSQGFIVSTEPSIQSRGGNSAQHTAIYYIANELKYNLIWDKMNFDQPLLHWNTVYWPGHRGHMSRDNLTCCVCALKLNKMRAELLLLMFKIFIRLGRMWNTRTIGATKNDKPWYEVDWCGPCMWFIAMRFKYSPLNWFADLYLCASTRVQVYNTRKNPSHSDGHHNAIILLETSRRISNNFILRKFCNWYRATGIPQAAILDCFDNEYSPPLHVPLQKIIDSW